MQDTREALARAAAMVDAGQFAEAEEIGRQILRQVPNCPSALVVLGIAARKTARPQEAVDWLRKACACRPDDSAIRTELGRALADCRRLNEAALELAWAAELNPGNAEACLNLGAVLGQLDSPEQAIRWCRRAVELAPDDAVARFNLGAIARSLGSLDEATAALEKAVRLAPDFAAAHWNLGYCYLLAGDFRLGWPEHEWRVPAGEVAIDRYPQPRWNGQSLAGRTILVHSEQGIGDEILFASCLGDVIESARHCVLVCEPRLEPLFRRSFPKATVHGFARRQDRQGMRLDELVAEPIDVQIPIGSLPLFLRPARHDFPNRDRFLTADASRMAEWKNRYEKLGAGLRVGISWRAGGQPSERRMRTTALDAWRPILAVREVQFVNLQYGDCVDDLAAARREMGVQIHDWPDADPLVDMDAFAAKIAALDLVVSVDNSTVHLSGALGVLTWALLPHVPGWRWSIGDERSVWYPSVRLLRQPTIGDWPAVFEAAARLLRSTIAAPSPGKAGADSATLNTPARPSLGEASLRRPAAVRDGNADPGKAGGGDRDGKVVGGLPWACGNPLPADGATSAEVGWGPTIAAARDAFERNDFATAEELARQVLDHAPRNVQAANLLGAIAGRTGRVDLAIRTLVRAKAMAADDPVVARNLAAALADSGQFDRAIDAYRRLLDEHPDSFDAWLGLGKTLHSAGRNAEAIAAVQKAVAIRPEAHKTFNLLGAWCLAAGRLAEAETALREAVRLRPDYMAAHNNLGIALERQNRLADARNCFAQAFALDHTCLQAANNLTSLENKLGQVPLVNISKPTT